MWVQARPARYAGEVRVWGNTHIYTYTHSADLLRHAQRSASPLHCPQFRQYDLLILATRLILNFLRSEMIQICPACQGHKHVGWWWGGVPWLYNEKYVAQC